MDNQTVIIYYSLTISKRIVNYYAGEEENSLKMRKYYNSNFDIYPFI
jgi:hypothetical protein